MLRIFATDSKGNRKEIKDLFWFEETGVRDFGGDGLYEKFTFDFEFGETLPPVTNRVRVNNFLRQKFNEIFGCAEIMGIGVTVGSEEVPDDDKGIMTRRATKERTLTITYRLE